MTEPNLSFAKIVANPNALSWSQVYNKGKLFAVLSLSTKEEVSEKDYLNVLGKEIFNILEQEYFTLETKVLESIKTAVVATSEKIPSDVTCSFVVGSVVSNILYVYILGDGRASLKRGKKLGNLLEEINQSTDSLRVASGFLENEDIIILQTRQFAQSISTGTLSEFVDNLAVADAAENLAPLVHEKGEAGAAAIIVEYKVIEQKKEPFSEPENQVVDSDQLEPETQEEKADESPFYTPDIKESYNVGPKKPLLASVIGKLRGVSVPRKIDLNHPRKIILTIVVVILIVFVGSIYFAINKQQDEKTKTFFNNIYPQAEKKYEEGQGLSDLNQSLARDSFQSAKQILESGKGKFPKNSTYDKQINDLLAKINSSLGTTAQSKTTIANPVDAKNSPILLSETKNNGQYYTQDDKNIYFVNSDGIFSLDQAGESKKEIIKNDSDWQSITGLGTFFGNFYVLDKSEKQILKFVSSGTDFSKTNYFTSANESLSKAVAMAIDSSIYVLTTDGNILKYTRGSADSFSLLGLDKNLSNPTRIITNADIDNIYVLDNGNSRIVVLDKTGKYKNSYESPIIKSAKDFEVLESDKKIYVLSANKVYEIDIK